MKPWTFSWLTIRPFTSPIAGGDDERDQHGGGDVRRLSGHDPGRRYAGQADDEGHGQVQRADQDHQGLADRDQAQDRRGRQDVVDVADAEEVAPCRAVRIAPTTIATSQHEVDDGGRVQRPQPRHHGATPAGPRPVASGRIVSSSDPAGSSPASRPSRITRIRSDIPIISGSSLDTIRTATPCAARPSHQLVDRVLGADVDAAGGLVEQHDRGLGRRASAPARPSAGCRRRGTAPPGPAPVRRPRASRGAAGPRGARRPCGGEDGVDHAERVVEQGLLQRQARAPCGPRSPARGPPGWRARGVRSVPVRPSTRTLRG